MAAARLTQSDATFSLKNVVLRKLNYPLVTTTFSCQQCDQIMSPILQQGLPKAGVIRTFPRALVHGPLDYGGLDIPHLYMEQMIAHIHTILRYGPDKDDPTGLLLHATGEAMRLELGYGGELLTAPLILAENVTNSWIKHVWQSTQECEVTLSTDFADIPLQRYGDIELMRLFIQNGCKQPALQTLNQCHMYLKVFRLLDIVNGSGECIAQQFWDRPYPAESHFEWPTTMAPSQQAWSTWHNVLSAALHLGRNQRLAIPLGRWFVQTHPNGWYYHSPTNSLWNVQANQWTRHGGIPRRTRQLSFHGTGETTAPPPLWSLEKATIARLGQRLLLTGYQSCEQAQAGIDQCQQLRENTFSRQWNLKVWLEGSQRAFIDRLSSGQGYAVCDGSFKDKSGAAAWIIEGPNSALRLMGNWHTPGMTSDHSSFRSELAGILGALHTLTFFPPTTEKPSLRLACDGLSVITRLQMQRLIDPTKPHADLLTAAKTLIDMSPYQIILAFVRGHQDTGYPTVLIHDAWLNVEVDLIAKETVKTPFASPQFYKLPSNSWGCYTENDAS